MKTESDLNKLLQDIMAHYGDAVQGSDEDYTLSDFVTYIVSEVMDASERIEVAVAIEVVQQMSDKPEDAAD